MSAEAGGIELIDVINLIVAAIAGAFSGYLLWRRDRKEAWLKHDLRAPKHRRALIHRYSADFADGYYDTLKLRLRWANRFYGPAHRWRALNRCWMIAIIYPLLASFFCWIFFNQYSFAGLNLFFDIQNDIDRVSSGLSLMAVIGFFSISARHTLRSLDISDQPRVASSSPMSKQPLLRPKTSVWSSTIITISTFAFTILGMFAVAITILYDTSAFPIAIAISGGVILGLALDSEDVVPLVLGLFILTAFSGAKQPLFILLFLLLPIANALADWASLIVTRCLLADMFRKRPGSWGLILHIFVDFLAAVICMALLFSGLWGLLTLWGNLSPTTVPLDPLAYWHQAQANLADGLMLWLMCLTTLLPTFIHGVWAVTLWRTRASDHIKAAVPLMDALPDTLGPEHEADLDRIADLIRKGRLSGFFRGAFWWGTVTIGLLVGAYLLILSPNGA